MSTTIERIAIHEAAHAVAEWASGRAVDYLAAATSGGICRPATRPSIGPIAELLCADVGIAAEEYWGHDADHFGARHDSREASEQIAALGIQGMTPQHRELSARRFIARHERAIAFLAGELGRRGSLSHDDLAALVWQHAELSIARPLYLKPLPARPSTLRFLRAELTGIAGSPDAKQKTLRGFVVAEEGEFIDQRGAFDRSALEEIVRLINADSRGMKSRFGHPHAGADAIGTHLGRVKNAVLGTATSRARKRVLAVRADLHFDPVASTSPRGNLTDYVLGLAASDSGALAASLVVRPRETDRYPAPPLWFPLEIHAVDIVDVGAATSGLLSRATALA